MEGKTILVTGGAGSIGSEIVRQLAPKNKVFVVDIDETRLFDLVEELRQEGYDVHGFVADIKEKDALISDDILIPDIVFNAAARKHVTPMEQTPMEAVNTNIIGTYNMIRFAKQFKAKLINISTDKAANTDSIMGATKKVAELMVKNAGYTSVRFGNVMGSRGSVIPIWQRQINQGKPLTITDARMERFMMTIPEAVKLVIDASQMENIEGKVVILDMGKPVNILSLAEDILNKCASKVGTKVIGIRPGESLTEKLMTQEEEARAVKQGNFFII